MHSTTSSLLLLALTALAAAAPAPLPQITPLPVPPRAANQKRDTQGTVTVVNSMPVALSTSVVSNSGNPTLVAGGATLTGTMAAGATATMVMPVGWSGNMALALANTSDLSSNNFATLIEPTLFNWNGKDMQDIDVSYVNGYTVPVICRCNTQRSMPKDRVLSGCTDDLWSMGSCGSDGEKLYQELGACSNPTNDGTFAQGAASPFFKPCEGLAYTYPADNGANDGGSCTEADITCCVGTEADGCVPASGSSSGSSGSGSAAASGGAAGATSSAVASPSVAARWMS